MDALILTCGTGGGHNSAAKAVKEEMERRGHHVHLMNPYMLRSMALTRAIDGPKDTRLSRVTLLQVA